MSINAQSILFIVKKNLILTVCTVLILAICIIIYSRSDLSDELNAEFASKSDEGNRYHANLANATQLSSELEAVGEANRIVRERAVNPADLALNLQYFYRIEKETGIKYLDLRQLGGDATKAPKAPKASKGPNSVYIPVGYTMSVQGDFPKIINFLRNLEQGTHFYRLTGLVADSTAENNLDINLNLNIDLLGRP